MNTQLLEEIVVNVRFNPVLDDAERRQALYAGEIMVYSDVPEIAAFAEFTRQLVTEAFAPHDPVHVHEFLSDDELADILIDFKPKFIHHPESMEHVRRITAALGCDPEEMHGDVPRLRTAFPAGKLNTGIAYAFQAHRDTWYAGPPQQINWWMPVWPAVPANVMEFFPRGFGNEIPNNSGDYNYYVANAWRGRIKDFSGGKDTRVHPAPHPPLTDDEQRVCVVPPVGGIMLFSGDQLHASVPNTSGVSRYSIDFRTVHAADVRAQVGAPRADVHCTGTAMRDFRRLTDNREFTPEEVAPYDDAEAAAAAGALTVFQPTTAS